jgi:hypothetical protein
VLQFRPRIVARSWALHAFEFSDLRNAGHNPPRLERCRKSEPPEITCQLNIYVDMAMGDDE